MNTESISRAIFNETNSRRLDNNLPPFHFSDKLNFAASLHSKNMLQFNFFSHENIFDVRFKNPKERITFYHGDFQIVGENIALMPLVKDGVIYSCRFLNLIDIPLSSGLCSAKEFAFSVVDSWMSSPGHRSNILKHTYQFMGIGTLFTKRFVKGQWVKYGIVTQNFGGYFNT